MARLTLTVSPEQSGRTVLSLLRRELGLSTGCVNRLKRVEAGLTCNGLRVFTNAVLQAGDILSVDLNAGETPTQIPPVPMDLDIVFEDEHLLVVNKSAPLAVIPSSLVPTEPTLAAGLMAYLGPSAAIHPVNRLDRGTTGLMVVAKSGYIHDQLRRRLSGDGEVELVLDEGVEGPGGLAVGGEPAEDGELHIIHDDFRPLFAITPLQLAQTLDDGDDGEPPGTAGGEHHLRRPGSPGAHAAGTGRRCGGQRHPPHRRRQPAPGHGHPAGRPDRDGDPLGRGPHPRRGRSRPCRTWPNGRKGS